MADNDDSIFEDAALYEPVWMRPELNKSQQMVGARAELDTLLQSMCTTAFSKQSEEELQTIEEQVHTMVAIATQLRERLSRKTKADKEVQTMATEQPI